MTSWHHIVSLDKNVVPLMAALSTLVFCLYFLVNGKFTPLYLLCKYNRLSMIEEMDIGNFRLVVLNFVFTLESPEKL